MYVQFLIQQLKNESQVSSFNRSGSQILVFVKVFGAAESGFLCFKKLLDRSGVRISKRFNHVGSERILHCMYLQLHLRRAEQGYSYCSKPIDRIGFIGVARTQTLLDFRTKSNESDCLDQL